MPIAVRVAGQWQLAAIGVGSAPTVPQNVAATSTVAGQIDVSWSAPASAGSSPVTGYVVTITAASGTATVINLASTARTTSKTGLVEGATYTVSVAAKNDVGIGPASAPISVAVARTVATGTNFLANPSAHGYPDATNTGSAAKATLTVYNGDITLGPGQTLKDTYLKGKLKFSGSGAAPQVSNVYVEAASSLDGPAIVDASAWSGSGPVLTDVTVVCTAGAPLTMIRGSSVSGVVMQWSRADISGYAQDLCDNTSAVFQDCYLHDINRSGKPGAHSDVAQIFIHGGAGEMTFRHCTLVPNYGTDPNNSVLEVGDFTGNVGMLVTIDDCLCGGGNYTVNANWKNLAPNGNGYSYVGAVVKNSRFARAGGAYYPPRYGPVAAYSAQYLTGYKNAPATAGGPAPVWSNNVYDDDGSLI